MQQSTFKVASGNGEVTEGETIRRRTTDDDTFNSAVNNISIILEQTKRSHTQTDINNVPTMLHMAKQKTSTTGHLSNLKKNGKTTPQTTTLQ